MQTVRKLRKRSGFTLVELLIVIIIIGILAGAMLLVAGSGTDSAEATKIISGLRSMKAAALMFYADKPKETPTRPLLSPYMDGTIDTKYDIVVDSDDTGNTRWLVTYNLAGSTQGVKDKLDDSDAVAVSADIASMRAR